MAPSSPAELAHPAPAGPPTAPAASTPPTPPRGSTPPISRGPIQADAAIIWNNNRTTEDMRARWAAGVRGAVAQRCPDCTAPLVWFRSELICHGCVHSNLPLHWRRSVTKMWLTGMGASEIAERVGSTKNAVLAYRRRHFLPPRGSPLLRTPDSARAAERARSAARRDMIKPKPKNLPRAVEPAPHVVRRTVRPLAATVPGGVVRSDVAERVGKGRPKGLRAPNVPGFTTCQYIIGRRRFCAEAVQERSPYCPHHTQLCYEPKRVAA